MTATTAAPFRRAVGALVAAAVLVGIATYANDASACACCSDRGERVESIAKMAAYERAELERIRFAKPARLFMNAAEEAGISGLADPTDTYTIALARQGAQWTFTLTDAKGKTGTLSFTLPPMLETFAVDTSAGATTGDPNLYKEWRINAPVTGTGIASGVGSGAMVRLVLNGDGNSCTQAEQFRRYWIIVSGPKVGFSLFGGLGAPSANAPAPPPTPPAPAPPKATSAPPKAAPPKP